jgi:hypothetical protein
VEQREARRARRRVSSPRRRRRHGGADRHLDEPTRIPSIPLNFGSRFPRLGSNSG